MRGTAVWRTWRSRPARSLVRTHSPAWIDGIDASQCALVVIDCQPEALDGVADADDLLFRTNAAVDAVRRHGGHLAFVRTALDELDYLAIPSTNSEASKWRQDRRFRNGMPSTDLHPAIAILDEDIALRKTRLGVFSTTNLDEQLTNLGVTTLILAGVHTSGAVLTTVREAADRDYRLIVLSDCTGDADLHAHDLSLFQVISRQAEILTTNQLARALVRRYESVTLS
ncbi:cysteine hydrolase [Mycolicibacterium pulveris]|uniref:Isochorismatase-like domain-containing protein n=1 Tax=Mycolicibacterium pulveris TaxID=36813 RepID=A0A7I7ULT5_MYCPV|nr:cysteine hydrolase [Mycolicibacterium pulveris]MCV6981134.1 cysteine hydrolase [Mycolicibacterium pulveris]BBY82428.1 hypothetical protein MPUL_35860 [Mycolicibacterium pulveris]